jgi:hypothetical protein
LASFRSRTIRPPFTGNAIRSTLNPLPSLWGYAAPILVQKALSPCPVMTKASWVGVAAGSAIRKEDKKRFLCRSCRQAVVGSLVQPPNTGPSVQWRPEGSRDRDVERLGAEPSRGDHLSLTDTYPTRAVYEDCWFRMDVVGSSLNLNHGLNQDGSEWDTIDALKR